MYVHTETYLQAFIATLFKIATNGKQPKHPSLGQGINKVQSIPTITHRSVTKRNKLLIQTATWMNPWCITLRERSRQQRVSTVYVIHMCRHITVNSTKQYNECILTIKE